MSERPLAQIRGDLVRQFCDLAKNAKPNTSEAIAAQTFLKETLMGVPAALAKLAHPARDKMAPYASAFNEAVVDIVKTQTGGELFSGDYQAKLALLSKEDRESGIVYAIDKVALQIGARAPVIGSCGGFGK